MNKTQTKNLFIAVITLSTLILISFGLAITGVITFEKPAATSNSIHVKLIINYGNGNIDTYDVTLVGLTVFNVLEKASEDYDFTFTAEYDEQYQSNYVHSINSVEEKNNLYWQYYLNGNYGVFGVDLQIVKDNDIIEWKYEESQI